MFDIIINNIINDFQYLFLAKTLLGYAFKALQISSKYFADVTGLVSIISTVYSVIADCESSSWGTKTKEYTDKAKEIIELINARSNDIYAIQLESKKFFIEPFYLD